MTRSDNERFFLTLLVGCALLAGLTLPFLSSVRAASTTFSASATVGSSTPSVYFIDAGQTLTGSAGTTRSVYVYFNASDANGYEDINNVSAVNVTLTNSSVTLTSSSCALLAGSGQMARYNCTITLNYYNSAGTWFIAAYVKDNSSNAASNISNQTLTVNNLDSIAVTKASISFSGSPNTNDIAATENPQVVNNTGNLNYTSINITGYAFTSGSNVIQVGNVTMNSTNTAGTGTILVNNSEVVLVNSSLARGIVATRDMYFWLDIPLGQPAGSYSAQQAWSVKSTV